jgi:UDPglucose--hexose-1-phosphate uridylyltransferase
VTPVRWDPLSGVPMLVAPARTLRPNDTAHPQQSMPGSVAGCPFCPGAEHETPPETWALRPDGSPSDGPGWLVRAVPNRFPVLTTDEGVHEVIVNSPRHVLHLWDLTPGELTVAIDGWAAREAAVREDPRDLVPFLFVNQGAGAGASLQHSHAQVIGFPFMPPLMADRRRRFAEADECPICAELRRPTTTRIVDTGQLAAWCPAAPPFSGAVRVAPVIHTAAWPAAPGASLATFLGPLLRELADACGTPALNLWLHHDPADPRRSYHWHLDVIPRRGLLAGMELGAGVLSIFTEPDDLARAVRDRLGSN